MVVLSGYQWVGGTAKMKEKLMDSNWAGTKDVHWVVESVESWVAL